MHEPYTHPLPQYSKDWFLFLIVATLVSVNTVILFLGTAIPQSRFNATLASDLQHPTAIVRMQPLIGFLTLKLSVAVFIS